MNNLKIAAEGICGVARYSQSSCTLSTFRLLRSVRLASLPPREFLRQLQLTFLACCAVFFIVGTAAAKPGDADKGKEIYDKRCIWCHGAEGDGAGAAKDRLNPPPRDFTSGNYKIKTSSF